MRNTAIDLFNIVGLSVEGHEELLERVATLLGEMMAALSVAHAMRDITFKQRINLFEAQQESLIEELKAFKNEATNLNS